MTDYGSLSQYMESSNSTASTVLGIIVWVLLIVANWKIFEKAGEAGWKSIIPIYSTYVLVKIVEGKGIKFLLLLVPIVNIVYYILLSLRMAKAFGKSTGFGIGLIFIPNLFTLILGFDSSQYVGPVTKN